MTHANRFWMGSYLLWLVSIVSLVVPSIAVAQATHPAFPSSVFTPTPELPLATPVVVPVGTRIAQGPGLHAWWRQRPDASTWRPVALLLTPALQASGHERTADVVRAFRVAGYREVGRQTLPAMRAGAEPSLPAGDAWTFLGLDGERVLVVVRPAPDRSLEGQGDGAIAWLVAVRTP